MPAQATLQQAPASQQKTEAKTETKEQSKEQTTPTTQTAPDGSSQAAEEQAPEIPSSGLEDPLLRRLFEDFGHVPPVTAAEASKPSETKPEQSAEQKTKPAPAPSGDEDEEIEQKPAKKLDVIPMPEAPLASITPQPPTQDQPSTTTPESKPQSSKPDDYEAKLTDEQKDELAEIRWAEKNLGDKYRGHPDKLITWYKHYEEKVREHLDENPDWTPDPDDEFLKKLRQSKPAINPTDVRKVQRGMAEEAVLDRVKKENEEQEKLHRKKLESLERKQRELEMKPVLDNRVQQFEEFFLKAIANDTASPASPIAKALLENDEQTITRDKLSADIVRNIKQRASVAARELWRFSEKLCEFEPDNKFHPFLAQMVSQAGEIFSQKGGDRRIKDGKTFVTRQQWSEIAAKNPDQLSKHWTWDTDDLIVLLAANAKGEAENSISTAKEWLKKYGYDRTEASGSAQAPNPGPEVNIEPINPPKAKGTTVKGPAETPPQPGQNPNDIDVVTVLGYMNETK